MTDLSRTSDTPHAPGGHRREWAWAVVAAVVVAIAAAGYLGWRHYARPTDPRYQAVLDVLAADPTAFPAKDVHGTLDLAGRFPGLTPQDEMVYARRPDGLTLALFPTYEGPGVSLAGLLHVSRPLTDADTIIRQPTLGREQRFVAVGGYAKLFIDQRIDDHWYQVSYNIR